MIYSKYYTADIYSYNDEYVAVSIHNVAVQLLRSRKFTDPYIMGYITPDTYPGCYNINYASYNSDQTRIQFDSSISKKNNIGWGYCDLSNYSTSESTQLIAVTQSNTIFDSRSNTSVCNPRLLNSVKMCNVNSTANGISVLIRGIIMPIAEEPVNDAILFSNSANRLVSATVYVNTIDYQNIIDTRDSTDPQKVTFSITFDGGSRSFSFSDNDFNKYNIAKLYDSSNQYVIYMTVIGFSFQTTCKFAYANGSNSTTYIQPFYRIPLNAHNTANIDTSIASMFIPGTFRPSDKRFYFLRDTETLQLYTNTFTASGYVAGYHIGNYPFTIDVAELKNIEGFTYNKQGVIYGKYILDSAGLSDSPRAYIFRIYSQNTLADGWNALNLYHKCAKQGQSYSNMDYYTYNGKFPVQIFTESNIPTNNRELVNIADTEQYNKLREWQKIGVDISENDFDPETIPIYIPIGGYDGDGDNILPPILSGIGDLTGFVTMYALKTDQLSYFGSQLWSSFTNPDFWNSISVVLENTTSIDPANILNYIISVRLYPFDLSTVSGAVPESPEIFFGRGLAGILVDSNIAHNIYTLGKCVTRVNGGILYVPEFYEDFRDMEPCAKMVLHVPFAGSCEINPSQVVGKYLWLSYSIDYCTGAFMAQCFVDGESLQMSYPVATLYGQLGATVQLSASNEMESLQCLAGATLGIASGAATGAFSSIMGTVTAASGAATSLANSRALPHTTGKSAGFSSFYEPRVPYIEILYDKYYVPDNYAHVHGYACNTVSKIGDLHGYTVCRNVDTTGLSCETDERLSIKRILESGFFVD